MDSSYYVCSVGAPGEKYDGENLLRCIVNKCFVLHKDAVNPGLTDQIKPGDVLILKYNHHFIGYGPATSSLRTDKDLSEGDGWHLRVDVAYWIITNPTHKYGISNAQSGGGPYDVIKRVEEEFARVKIQQMGGPAISA